MMTVEKEGINRISQLQAHLSGGEGSSRYNGKHWSVKTGITNLGSKFPREALRAITSQEQNSQDGLVNGEPRPAEDA